MIFSIKKLFKPVFFCCAFYLHSINASAQISLLQNVIHKIESHKNFSYQFINKRKDFTNDTVIVHNKQSFLKAPTDSVFGYLFKLEIVYKTEKLIRTDLYNGKQLIDVFPDEGTYEIQKIRPAAVWGTLLDNLHWIKGFVDKKPAAIVKATDTIINNVHSTHLIVKTYDTIINKEHYYTLKHVFINKQSDLPTTIITQSRNNSTGDGISNYYDEVCYYDYEFDQENIDIKSFSIPMGFRPREMKSAPDLLTAGTTAPNWTLYTADGKKTSLNQLKGKILLLDFYFIGCVPCMSTIKPLNKLYEKYQGKNILIASVTGRDNPKTVSAFKKQYGIKYTGYADAADVVKSYHVSNFPTFYFIDKAGKIANVVVGSDNFEEKITSIIDKLLDN
jgi:peroxiredoxin